MSAKPQMTPNLAEARVFTNRGSADSAARRAAVKLGLQACYGGSGTLKGKRYVAYVDGYGWLKGVQT